MHTFLKRGHLTFRRVGANESNIECTLGDPKDPESEFIFQVHEYYIDDIIAGLTAMKKK